ncbi:MAG TPA: hypothetical protein VF384_01775 [Planctomycetota bacterium]
MIRSPANAPDLVEIAPPILAVAMLFAVVAWICRPRPRSAARTSERAKHFVELTNVSSAIEAEQLAARLRHRGVVALANAAPLPRTSSGSGVLSSEELRPFVAVISTDLDRARAILVEEQKPEGDASREEIERLLADEDAIDADWQNVDAKETGLGRFATVCNTILRWGTRVLVLALVLLAAWLVLASLQ